MAVQWSEDFNSREAFRSPEGGGVILRYTLWGDTNEVNVFTALAQPQAAGTPIAPYTYDGFNRAEVKIIPLGGGVWKGVVNYGAQPVIGALDYVNTFNQYGGLTVARGPEFSCDTTAKSVHVTQSLFTRYRISGQAGSQDTIASGTNLTITTLNPPNCRVVPDGYTVVSGDLNKIVVIGPGQGWTPGVYQIIAVNVGGGTWTLNQIAGAAGLAGGNWTLYSSNVGSNTGGQAPDYKQAIGVTLSEVLGTDILVPTLEWTVSGNLAPFSAQQIISYYQTSGKINKNTFWGFAAGEVLYLGATAQTTDGIQFRITHKFMAQPSQYNLQVSSTITIPFKAGWDYVWCRYGPSADKNVPIQIPTDAYVEQVYQSTDFSILGLG